MRAVVEELRHSSPDGTKLESFGFGSILHTCGDSNTDYPIGQRELPLLTAIYADDLVALDVKAGEVLNKHFEAHRAAKTRPCIPIIDRPSAIFMDENNHSLWIPVGELTA